MKNRLIRRGIIVVALLATLPGMPVVAAQTLDEAMAAYERGDYACEKVYEFIHPETPLRAWN